MEFLINLLTDPKMLGVLTLPVVCMAIEGYAIYKLFTMNTTLQEKRLEEWKKINEDYINLAKDVNSTLDLLIKLSGKRNENGGK